MIYRFGYTGQLKEGEKENFKLAVEAGNFPQSVISLSVMHWKNRVFLYYESRDDMTVTPHSLFGDMSAYLVTWPGEKEERLWIQMYDIFHYNRPVDDDEWTRHIEMRPFGRLMRIKPEMLASYIYYHHQLQEEKPGLSNKYGVIFMHENLLLFYLEDPEIVETLTFKGRLDTHNSPDNWHEVMEPHFMPWDDTDPPIQWREDVELLFNCQKIIPNN